MKSSYQSRKIVCLALLICISCFGLFAEELQTDESKKYTDFQTFCFEFPDSTNAIGLLETLDRNNPDNFELKIVLADRYIQAYRFDESIKTAEKAIQIKPDDWRGHTVLALARIHDCRYPAGRAWGIDMQKFELVKPPLKKAMECSKDAVFPRVLNCYVMAMYGEQEMGLLEIEKYILNETEPVDVWLWKGRIYELCETDYGEAKDCFDRVRLFYPEAHLEWGNFLRDLAIEMSTIRSKSDAYFIAMCDTAIEYNEKLVEVYPDNYMPYYNIGSVYALYLNETQKSIDYFTKSLERRETVVAYLSRSQLFYQKTDDIERAIKDVERGVEIAPDKSLLCEDIFSSIHEKGASKTMGLLWIDECIKQEPTNGDMYFLRGYVHELKNEYSQAQENYRKAIGLKAHKYLDLAEEYLNNSPQ